MSLANQASPVAAPVAASPTSALIQEFVTILESSLNLTFVVVLNPSLPLVANQPAGDKVVVVSIQDPLPPFLVSKPVKEIVALQNLRSVGASAARHARCTAVHVVSGRDLEVSALDVGSAQPVPQTVSQGLIPVAADSLAGADTPNLGIFKGSENPWHEGGRPSDIVVSHDGDSCSNLGECLADLKSLVGNGGIKDSDGGVVEGLDELIERLAFVMRGDEDQFSGLTRKNTLQRRSKFLKHIMNRRNDNGDVLVGELGLVCNGLGLVSPVADTVNKETEIAMNPIDQLANKVLQRARCRKTNQRIEKTTAQKRGEDHKSETEPSKPRTGVSRGERTD